jgi:hypothetical protein
MPYVSDPRVSDVSGVTVEGGPYLPDEIRLAPMTCREWFVEAGAIGRVDEAVAIETATGWLRSDMGTRVLPRLEGELTFDGGDGVLRRVVLSSSIVAAVGSCGF